MEEPTNQKRQIAFKVCVKEILNGKYYIEDGWMPNYVLTETGKKLARINIMGIVVAKPNEGDNYESIIIDDGTGEIGVRGFEQGIFKNINIGNYLMIIGRPREYGNEVYILPEILKKVEPGWLKIRKKELENTECVNIKIKPEIEEKVEVERVINETESEEDKVIEFIKNNDKGEGVDASEIMKIPNGEKLINSLLECGEIFEVRPGKLKVLE